MSKLEDAIILLKEEQLRQLLVLVRDQLTGLMGSEEIADAVMLVQVQVLEEQKPTTCQAEDACDRPVYAKGLCVMHYARLRRYGSVFRKRAQPYGNQPCSMAGCTKPARALGYCWNHYKKLQRVSQS